MKFNALTKAEFFQSKTKPNPQSKTGQWIYKRWILCVLKRLLKWRSTRAFNTGKLLLQALSLQAIWFLNQTNANENVICNFLQRASQWQHFKTRRQNLKVAFKVDDKSPTRSKIAHFSWQGLELVLCPFSDKDMSSTFFETLRRTQGGFFAAVAQRAHSAARAQNIVSTQMPSLQPCMGHLERDVAIICLERRLAARSQTQLRYVWSKRRGNKAQHWSEMKQLSGLKPLNWGQIY